jgi:alkylation response protein AidB-like acyl-CoA dehydrogenase
MAAGECYFCIGMSEPDSGSDLASIRTSGTPVPGGWLVNGAKIWTSHAHHAHFMLALVRTSTGPQKHDGMSQLIIDMTTPGVEVRPIRLLTGEHHFNEVVLRDVFVPESRLLGTEGNGWAQALAELAFERSGPERFLSTYPLLVELIRCAPQDDRSNEIVGRLVARLTTLRQMSFSVAAAIEAGIAPAVDGAIVKYLGTRFECEIAEGARSVQAKGELLEELMRQAVLSAPGFTLRGGTTEVLLGVIAKSLR